MHDSTYVRKVKDTYALFQMSYSVPRLCGQLKTHKTNMSIRPVVACYSSPNFKVSKYLGTWFKFFSNFEPRFTVLNSTVLNNDLVGKTFCMGSRLIFFDLVNMFNTIPIKETIDLMCDWLKKMNWEDEVIAEFRGLITLCLEDNICFFNGSIYRFPDGLPMGGPLSSLVADIYMGHIKHLIHSPEFPYSQRIAYWKRYVDDIICIWQGSDQELEAFFDKLNSVNPHIKFTMEMGNLLLNYLDPTIRLVERDSVLTPSFEIFRKPTFTGVSIHSSSLHPRQHKMAVIHSAINRLLNLPLQPAAVKKEVHDIQKIADINNLKVNVGT